MEERLFSLKILFHRLKINPNSFGDSDISFDNPSLAVKFLNYPTFLIKSKKNWFFFNFFFFSKFENLEKNCIGSWTWWIQIKNRQEYSIQSKDKRVEWTDRFLQSQSEFNKFQNSVKIIFLKQKILNFFFKEKQKNLDF